MSIGLIEGDAMQLAASNQADLMTFTLMTSNLLKGITEKDLQYK